MHLGIDIGTSKNAAVIIDSTGNLIADVSIMHNADVLAKDNQSQQNPTQLLEGVFQCVNNLPLDFRSSVTSIGVTGQMHGVLLNDVRNVQIYFSLCKPFPLP